MRLALLAILALGCDTDDLLHAEKPGPSKIQYCTHLSNMQEHGWQLDFYNDCLHGHASQMDGGVD